MGWDLELVDEGCELWGNCLGCPLPVCREDTGLVQARKVAVAAGFPVLNRPAPGYHLGSDEGIRFEPQLRYLFSQGYSAEDAQAELGVAQTYARRAWDLYGDPHRVDPELAKAMAAYRDAGVSSTDIGVAHGFSRHTVWYHAKKARLENAAA